MGAHGWLAALVLSAQAVGAGLTVEVMNAARVPESEVRKAVDEAGWILRKAGVEARWVVCEISGSDWRKAPGCVPRSEPELYVVTILPEVPAADGVPSTSLGFAVLVGQKNSAAVIYPRVVAWRSEHLEHAHCNILASVIAHELGHLLIGSNEHGAGLMKANWDAADFEAMARRQLVFSDRQVRLLRTRRLTLATRE